MKHQRGAHSEANTLTRKQVVEAALNDPIAKSAASTPLIERRRTLYSESAAGVLADLAAVGFAGIEEVGELRRHGIDYRAAVPILIEWLPKVRYLLLAEDIVRTLSVRFAKKIALPEFLRLFREPLSVEDPIRPATSEPPEEHLRWVIGNGLGIFADPSVADDLIELALDRRFGQARTQIVGALPKTKNERVPVVLLGLLDDPTVAAFAVEALGKIKYTGARASIEELLTHSDKNVRTQAKKALRRIDG